MLMENNLEMNEIQEKLLSEYGADYYFSVLDIVKNLNFDTIVLNTLSRKQTTSRKVHIKRLLNRLQKSYLSNVPSQKMLQNIFEWE